MPMLEHTEGRPQSCASADCVCIQGSYWSLEKRAADLPGIPAEWAKTVAAFGGFDPATFSRPSVVALGTRLQAAAKKLAEPLQPRGAGVEVGLTLLHGDFKTANLFISGMPPGASPGMAARLISVKYLTLNMGLDVNSRLSLLVSDYSGSTDQHDGLKSYRVIHASVFRA